MLPDADVLDDDVLSNEQFRARQAQTPGELMRLEQIDGAEINWLWPDRIPLGHVTIVAGASGSGKSMLAAELAAHVSSGAMWPGAAGPGATSGPPAGTVLIAQANRHENSVLKRRLLAAGADERRLAVINRHTQSDDHAQLGDEMAPGELLLCKLEGALVQARGVSLVVLDDLVAWLGPKRLPPDELALLFQQLADLAARRRIALVVVWRLEKGVRGGQARLLDWLQAAAPVVWLLARDSYASEERLAVCTANQLGRQAENLAFRIADHRLVWQAAARQATADDVVATHTADRHERRQAGEWLRDVLARGPIEAKRLWDEARQCGLAERTVRRASAELGLRPTKDGKSGTWYWGVGFPRVVQSAANGEALPVGDSAPSVAALPGVGSLAGEAVVQVELRREAAPRVAALPGSLAESAVAGQVPSSAKAAPSVAAFPPAGSLANPEAPPPAAARSARQRNRLTRRERQALERTMQICRDG
jgi:putative DNA primase/helicase